MKAMVKLAYDLRSEFQRNNISSFGDILHEGWVLKKSLTKGISSPANRRLVQEGARKAARAAGKLLGAGSGGFMIFQRAGRAPREYPRTRFPTCGKLNFGFEPQGSRIIFVH